MNRRTRRISWYNALGLCAALPFVMRMTWEATVLRVSRGPQMLGFTFVHGGGGVLGTLAYLSMVLTALYVIFALIALALFLLPSVRAGSGAAPSVALGLSLVVGHCVLSGLLQRELPPALLTVGMVGLVAIAVALGCVCYFELQAHVLHTRSVPTS